MPVAAHIDPDSHIVLFRCSGEVGIHEARRAFDHMITDPALDAGTRAMWDLRGAAIEEKPRAIPDIVDMLQHRHPERVRGGRFAILLDEQNGQDVATRAAVTSDSLHVRFFSSYANAARWLDGDDA
ncbi:MAG TPA: hypothetical protein VF247_05525 [Candidatus Krumholzibacteria bacterium]